MCWKVSVFTHKHEECLIDQHQQIPSQSGRVQSFNTCVGSKRARSRSSSLSLGNSLLTVVSRKSEGSCMQFLSPTMMPCVCVYQGDKEAERQRGREAERQRGRESVCVRQSDTETERHTLETQHLRWQHCLTRVTVEDKQPYKLTNSQRPKGTMLRVSR
jgi:hypothetical protein